MPETIDLIALRSFKRKLATYTRTTKQPTSLDLLDLEPLRQMRSIDITEEQITITYNETIEHRYNTNIITRTEWAYKYNDDPEFVAAVGKLLDLARKHLHDLPDNVACPPGCAQCCSGYEPFVSKEDLERIAAHLGMTYRETLNTYVVKRPSADGFSLGYLRKVTDDVADQCVFLKGKASGAHYCGIYEARPRDCRTFTPIACPDVDTNLSREGQYPVGAAFRPRHVRPKLRTR